METKMFLTCNVFFKQQESRYLLEMNLSNNGFAEEAGALLGPAIGESRKSIINKCIFIFRMLTNVLKSISIAPVKVYLYFKTWSGFLRRVRIHMYSIGWCLDAGEFRENEIINCPLMRKNDSQKR